MPQRVTLSYERLVEICQDHYNSPRKPIRDLVRDHEWDGVEREPVCQCGHERFSHSPIDDGASYGECDLIGCECKKYRKDENA